MVEVLTDRFGKVWEVYLLVGRHTSNFTSFPENGYTVHVVRFRHISSANRLRIGMIRRNNISAERFVRTDVSGTFWKRAHSVVYRRDYARRCGRVLSL